MAYLQVDEDLIPFASILYITGRDVYFSTEEQGYFSLKDVGQEDWYRFIADYKEWLRLT